MLIVSLIVSMLLLWPITMSVYSYRCTGKQAFLYTCIGLAGSLVSTLLCYAVLIPVIVLAVLLCLAALLGIALAWKPRSFSLLYLAAALITPGIVYGLALLETAALREQYPVVSMEERLPVPKRTQSLTADSRENLRYLELHLEIEATRSYGHPDHERRLEGYKELHEQTVSRFVRSQGFGWGRMAILWPNRTEPPPRMWDLILQPGERTAPVLSPGQLETLPPPKKDDWPSDLHVEGVRDFVNPAGFGYFKDRRHVVGFQHHHFSKVPESIRWQVQTLDLIGLVVHERPVAYVSDQLPRMDELKKVPTRQLDDFESLGLAALEKGEDLFVRDLPGGRRMLGAVRSAKQCVACHGGERGDLLGAFSYTLKRAEP